MHLDNRSTIIFNGEIYNHTALRKQFNLDGSTHSDTETLLMLYHKLGAGMLQWLDGMFAFAIYDSEEKSFSLPGTGREKSHSTFTTIDPK